MTTTATVPEWDAADRLRKALRTSDVSVQEMAAYLGVSRNAVGNWINGRVTPSTQTMRLWAIRCGVPYEWLRDGDSGSPDGPGPQAVNRCTQPWVVRLPLAVNGDRSLTGEHHRRDRAA